MFSHRRSLFLLGVLLNCFFLSSIAFPTEPVKYNSHVWQVAHGLPNATVQTVAQTLDGYLWVGTFRGLARFDGMRFTTFDDPAVPELNTASINALIVTTNGCLWIGTAREGIFRFHKGRFSKLPLPPVLEGVPILSFFENTDGKLWIGTRDGLVWHPGDDSTELNPVSDVPRTTIRSMAKHDNRAFWIGSSAGLILYNEKIIAQHVSTNRLANNKTLRSSFLRSVCQTRDGSVWSGSNVGLSRMKNGSFQHYSKPDGLKDTTVTAIHEDKQGTLWVGSYGGLFRMAGQKLVMELSATGLPYDVVYSFFEDREGNLWVAAKDGLCRLNPRHLKTLTTRDGLTHNNVMSVSEDKTGTLWIGTWGGSLNLMRQTTISASTNILRSDLILGLCHSPDGSLWVGTDYDHGLFQIKDGKVRRFGREQGFPCYSLRTLASDQRTNLWICTATGLTRFNGQKFDNFTSVNGLPSGKIRVLVEGRQGLWIGADGGLALGKNAKFTLFPPESSVQETVSALYEDEDETLWIGTIGAGLWRWKNGKITTYNTTHGLFDNDIFEIVEDHQKRVWMTSLRGIFHISKKEFEEMDQGQRVRLDGILFDTTDGLTHIQCNGVAKPGAIRRRDGTLAFATTKGVVAIDPRADLGKNEIPPAVVIAKVFADKKNIHDSDQPSDARRKPGRRENEIALLVAPGRGDFEFHYTALSFTAPEKNRFKYRLENVDDDWIDARTERVAHYSKLSPGDYTFRVIASNNDGVWNEVGASVKFTLEPYFWQTLPFKWAVGIFLASLALLAYRVRVARIRALEQLRLRIAADLHDDVGSHLTKISMLMEAANRETSENQQAKPLIHEAMLTNREVMMAMDEIVWTIKPKNDTVENLANYIFRYTQRYCKGTNIRCSLDIPTSLPDDPIPPDARHNVFLAFKEALQNAVKHSNATELKVTVGYTNKTFSLSIADNGSGFSAENAAKKGNGLSNMKRRLDDVHGSFRLESAEGKGTRIEFQLKL